MERWFLQRCLDEGLSLEQIGALENRDPSTIRYWLDKHGLVANGSARHRARGGLTREQLEPLVERDLTFREMAAELDRSVSTVRYWLRQYGLLVPRKRRERALAAREAGHPRFSARCRKHAVTDFVALPDGRSRCARCNADAVAAFRRRMKRRLIAEAGGGCAACGYDRFAGALHFHHIDPAQKRFGLAERGVSRSHARVQEEVAKCVLLCANCHAEVEGGFRHLAVK